MLDYSRDFLNTINRKDNRMSCYDSLYFSSNENFGELFSCVDLKDKDVFSIVGSGDQSLYFYNSGAKQVDLFDINIVSIYYYYLRLWCLKYLSDLYPIVSIDYFKNLLSKVRPGNKEEENAYYYWSRFLNYIDHDHELLSLFFLGDKLTLNEYIDDVSKLNEIVSSKRIDFTPMDITKSVNKDKQYDVIFVSNITEYTRLGRSFYIYRDNLDRLLKDDGVVIASNIMYPCPTNTERRILSKNFDYHEIKKKRNDKKCSSGYYYTKR